MAKQWVFATFDKVPLPSTISAFDDSVSTCFNLNHVVVFGDSLKQKYGLFSSFLLHYFVVDGIGIYLRGI